MDDAAAGVTKRRSWFDRFLHTLRTPPTGRGTAWLASATVAFALALGLLGATLHVPSGFGVQDWLGWADPAGSGGPVDAMLRLWATSGRSGLVLLYLGLDSALFVPVYASFLFAAALRLADALADDGDPQAVSPIERWLLIVLALPVAALVLVDLLENSLGLARFGLWGSTLALASGAFGLLALLRSAAARAALRRLGRALAAVLLLLSLVLGLAYASAACSDLGAASGWPAFVGRLACAAHQGKNGLVALALLLPLLTLAAWLFGVRLQPARQPLAQDQRARLRRAIWDCFVRSRYVLLALVLVAALTVVMDQGRDVLYAIAAAPFREAEFTLPQRALLVLGTLLATIASALAIALLMFACWLWTRSVCLLRSVHSATPPLGDPPGPADRFAAGWARLLGVVPAVLMVVLCGGVIRDSVMAQAAGAPRWMGPVALVLVFGVGMLAAGLGFLRRCSRSAQARYHDCIDWREWSARAGFWEPITSKEGATPSGGKFKLAGRIGAHRLPVLLGIGMLVCRLVDVFPPGWLGWQQDYVPTMSLAVMLFEIALWLCFFGWLSLLEVQRSVPWVGLLIALVGLLGVLGWTTNHLSWPPLEPAGAAPAGALRMLAFTLGLALVLWGAYAWVMALVRRLAPPVPAGGTPARLRWRDGVAPVLLLAATALVIAAADHFASTRRPDAGSTSARLDWHRPTLDIALADWLAALCNAPAAGGGPCGPIVPLAADGSLDVYLVSTEGGGIRAAVWTALVLQRLAQSDAHFGARTFSISGVSGGAIGAAAFRACSAEPAQRAACLDRLARTDLLAPLVSAWLFEDALARVLPTRWCTTPGCGFLSRGAWFEQAMEAAVPGFRQGLIASREQLAAARAEGPHVPYLLLNATWVESGERAVASDLRIDWRQFRGAKDQLRITGRDLPLGSAAHNAARFPFVNAIGALTAPQQRCLTRVADPLPHETAASAPELGTGGERRETCGHLADGGYFDNSGGQSTLDVIQGLARCLEVKANDGDAALFRKCLAMDAGQRQWLRERLVPQVLMIRNGVQPVAAREELCPLAGVRPAPGADEVAPPPRGACSDLTDRGYHPERPVCRHRAELFVDVVGPALAVLNVSGIGANGLLAEARQAQAVRALRLILGGAAARTTRAPTRVLDLLPDGIRYPLGWHLSGVAVDGMWAQSEGCAP
ncbi:hypothetical protein HLB44_00860 [Aquincola sp. S2]|uniref:PNPLA domain-containing protein n=1 Tax=Pseudaquabacterium terrae TaxID=2732868 RepID=A0ABX2ECJ1_9BURK|nr:hypothetical protein [Aquabacterium terrae]NRF65522.1 hypothetical protein [Aquabacterium terrae]